MLGRFSYETSLLARFEILGLFVNTLSSHERYSGHNRENFPKPIQMQLSKNLKTFSEFFIRFLKSTQNLENSGKKMIILIALRFLKLLTPKGVVT